ncbi:GatB/YqeY domain-containing protein [Magnetovibrio sp. PR-2]|uniref:GatB/YqeY domain-containing protein n=1 Tax=Magnetovibrio sp. PR-2 TaxID=3120356 RepID=UPI002FCE22AD
MLRDQLTQSMKTAMKEKDEIGLASVRLIQAALKDRDIAARSNGNNDGISDDEILSMLQSMIKQRRDSIEMYEKGGRPELAEREAKEIDVIERFLPEQMDDDAAAAAIDKVIDELDANAMKDMGRVMAALKERHAGCMDFGKASGVVKARLSGG